MFEALGCGKPFVGSNVGGIPEIIISEDFGLICEPSNPKDLTDKILIAMDKKWEHKKIILKSTSEICSLFFDCNFDTPAFGFFYCE